MDDTSGSAGPGRISQSRQPDGPRAKRRRRMRPKRDAIKQYFFATALQAKHLWSSNPEMLPDTFG
ncbi:hypothetical protein AGR4B_Cc70261 [Agrobacterium tumefaciens str. CFBP 5621]|nr:hypothetical protein AGR4B_Cc70261 [Agrobacterium tumefaciens str. CFBP 5621]